MAHEIDTSNGRASVFTVAEPAWHGLGTVLDNPATAEEAIKAANLDWEVKKKPLYYDLHGAFVESSSFATVRMDTGAELGTVGKGYTVIQNRDVFSFFDSLVDKEDAIYHTAGALGVGERVWVMAKMPAYIQVGDDKIEQYVLLHNTHGGSGAIIAAVTPIRVVCNNTLTAAISGARNKVSIRHTKNAEERLAQAATLLGITNRYKAEIEPIFNAMAHKSIKSADLNLMIDSMYPEDPEKEVQTVVGSKVRNGIIEAFETGVGQDMPTTRGTLFGFYNAVTYYLDHVRDYKNKSSRAQGIWFDGNKGMRQRAFDVSLAALS